MKFSNLLSLSFAFSSTVAGLPTDIEASATSALDKRAFAGPPVCHFNYANHIAHFNNGIGEVRSMNRIIAFAPRFCVRVTCRNSAGIAVCNDNPNRVINLHTNTIYDYYVRIADGPGDCILFGSNLGGQQFDTDGWNVIAIKMNCAAPGVWTVDQWPAQP
ncbi:Ff.00g129570.m01.CDS01 [Fusarium sp. VM40]|nr:Ff.00g129570.m01.CDS01 [Fusarium sp. VM40]